MEGLFSLVDPDTTLSVGPDVKSGILKSKKNVSLRHSAPDARTPKNGSGRMD